ncbi:zinc transporter [Tranquillimonas rosea]|uniref:Zinc transporter n=1 Tax=Tranquillimonas rosea TaxID=641238 RepID=A0A1H9X9F5_9RHOB|nr:zinc transporter ZntB [Tranquillimonas rosea]SES42762.1 zinc transporter [Tranquillimonas rosea]
MSEHVHFAYRLGAARPSDLTDHDEIAEAVRHDDPAWLHLMADHPETPGWIDEYLSFLDPAIREALTAAETRPRTRRIGSGVLVVLRGVNLNPGADPEDMVSLRLWVDPARVVTLARRPLRSVDALKAEIEGGNGPRSAPALLSAIIDRIVDRIEPVLTDLDDRTDELEEVVIDGPDARLRETITDMRLQAAGFRRYLAPQRDALGELGRLRLPWLEGPEQSEIGENHDRMIRVVEEAESIRDRLQLIDGELAGAVAERLNRNLYVLSMISAIFLPLGFLTGLMGINLAGMPGAAWEPAFWVFTGGLAVLVGIVLLLLRRARWL